MMNACLCLLVMLVHDECLSCDSVASHYPHPLIPYEVAGLRAGLTAYGAGSQDDVLSGREEPQILLLDQHSCHQHDAVTDVAAAALFLAGRAAPPEARCARGRGLQATSRMACKRKRMSMDGGVPYQER